MSLIKSIKKKYQSDGFFALLRSSLQYLASRKNCYLRDALIGALINRKAYEIYEKEWDLLIVLDGCRYDVMESVSAHYPFVENVQAKYSPASSSREWLQRQFRSQYADEIRETAYITGNTFSNEVLDSEDFALLDEVWKYGWDDATGIVLPRPITDRAISVARTHQPNRMIVHYMQPHFPSLENPEMGGQVDPEKNRWINSVWSQLEAGELSHETVWNAYESNLKRVLTEVELLLNNADFETVIITADHGNGFGEFGIYGHPSDRVHPSLRKVPWITTTAEDTGNHTQKEYNRDKDDVAVNDRLAALGYL